MIKRIFYIFVFFVVAFGARAKVSSLVVDAQSGYVLHAKNADAKQFPASLTKVMTLYITFDALEKGLISMDDLLPVSEHAAAQPKSNLGLKAGSVISVRDAISALIVKSANDAAVVLAESFAPTEDEFAVKMTRVAQSLGLTDTVFKNASGLHNPQQTTSAKDMAILTIALINHFPQYYPLFSMKSFEFNGKTYYSHNSVLLYYDGAEGFKTGFVSAVGYNVISTASRDGRRLVGVIIGQKTPEKRDRQMYGLLDAGFEKVKQEQKKLATLGTNPFLQKAFVYRTHQGLYDPLLKVNVQDAKEKARKIASVDKEPLLEKTKTLAYAKPFHNGIEQGDYTPLNWKIQVGALKTQEQAFEQATKAKNVLKIAGIDVQTPNYKKLFRSRLAGFETKEDAFLACQQLSSNAIPCFVVPPNKP